VLLLELTLCSAIDAYAMSLFWVHMVEHLMLITVVPAFLVLGRPIGTVVDALPDDRRDRAMKVLGGPVASVLTHPVTGIGVYAVVIVGTHLTGFMDRMAMHSWVMTFEQVLYLAAGWLMLTSLIGDEPGRRPASYAARVVGLLVAMVPDTVVGIVLLQASTNPFPMYGAMRPSWAGDPLHDVNVGGALMWAGGDGLMMLLGIGVVLVVIASESRQGDVLGPWLQSARSQHLSSSLSTTLGEESPADLDPDSEDAHDAYNRMLRRLQDHEGR
jgi:cytochrome c oxidase assembly factor CtaG